MIINFIIGAAISIVSGLHSRRKAKKQQARLDAEMDKQKGFDVPVDGEAINLPLVYGYAKVGGVRSVVHTADNGAIVAPPSGFEDRSVNLGVGSHDGSKKEFMVVGQAFCYGDIDEFLDFEVDGQNYDYHKFSHHIRLSKNGGVADPTAVAFNVPLGNTNKFTGMAWASQVYKLNRDDPEYSGTPNLTAYIRGTRVRDIFNDNGEWKFSNDYTFSNNSAVVIADYLTRPIEKGGRGLPDNKVDLASFGHAKAICDTIVASDVDVRGRVNGVRPVQDGQVEPLPSKRDLRLYECNIVIDTSSPSRDIIEQLLETMAQAKLVYSNGIYKLKLDYPASDVEQDNLITATYSDSDILGKIEVAVAGASERFNRCEVKFKNESMDYANDSVSWPVRGSAAHVQYLAEDNGKPNETTYTLFGGTHRQSALAKAEEIVRESRIGKTIKFKIDRKGALVHEIGDIFKLNSVASKITNELFKITGIRIDAELNATIQAERFDWNSLSWNVEDSYVEPAIVIPGTVVPNVSNLTWTDGSRIGDNKNNGYLTWTAPDTTSVRRYHIWAKRPSVGDWVKISETVEDYFDIPADFNSEGHDYQFLVRTENSRGYISQGAMVLADQMPNLVPVHGVTKEVGLNTVKLAWSNAVPQLVGAYRVYMGTSNVRGDAVLYGTTASTEMVISPLAVSSYYFWIDAIGMDGSVAAGSATVVSALELGIKSGDISANTITWGHLANNVQADMEGYVASANAHAQAANTSAQAAQVHANSANTSKTTAQNAATSANNSASAASTSASQASISANNSAQSAAASANSALTANTHAGTAKTYRDQAAISENDAAGSATAAATSAGVAVDAQNDVISLNGNPYFKFGKAGYKAYNSANTAAFNAMTVVSGPTAGKALQHTSPEQVRFLSDATIPVDTDRSYRLTMRAKAVGGFSRVYAGAHFYDESGSIIGTRYFGANSRNIYAVDDWVQLRGVVSGIGSAQSNFPDGTSYIRTLVILQYTNSTATSALIDALLFEDVTESKSAEASASAASTSASSAAASANSAGQSAASANSSKNSAETARSQALTYRNEAATSSTLAAEHSRLNMVGRSTFAPGEFAPWEDKYSVVSVSGHPNGQTHALRQTDRDLYTVASIVEQINNRVFRISGVVDNSNSPFEARAGIRIIKSDGNYHWPTVHIASANEGVKRFDVTLTISNNDYVDNQSFRFFLQSNGPSGSANGHRIDWSEVRYEDVTESDKAAQSASAAAIVEGVVTKTLGSENFSNPVFRTWKTSPEMPHGFGDVQSSENRYFSRVPGKYYDAVQFNILDKNSGSANRPFCRIDSKYHNELELPSANKMDAVRVTLEVEKISGDWGGACSRVSWIRADTGGTNAHQYYYFDDNLSDENGVIQTVEFEMTKPDGFNPGTNPNGSYLALYFFGTSEYGGRANQNVKWKLHRCSIKQITQGASTQISQKAISDIEGNQSAAIVMRASTSNSALLELSSLKDAETGGSITAARISAESILLDGSVSARKMDVNGLLKISDHGALSIGKESASDYANSGIFFGRDGSNTGFGFFAGRRDGNEEQYIRVVKDSFTIRNAQFEIASDTASTSSYAQSGTYALASGVATIAALTLVGGGGGGGAAASDSQNGNSGQSGYPTIVELIDKDNNVIQTWTQNGGAGGPGGRSSSFGDPNNQSEGPWLWSQKSPYGNGGRGATGGNRESGEAGRASPILNISNIDVSGVDEPKLRITIGAGGLGGYNTSSSRVGSPGNAGLVQVSAEGAGVIPAGVLAQEPAVSGTMAVVTGDNNNFNRFPDLGPGMWAVQGGYWKIVDGHSIHPDIHTFVARTRPGVTYSGGGGHHTLNYYFWPLK